jgi:hypothetical protein
MQLPVAKPGEKFFVRVKPQKKGNNFTNTAITEALDALQIAEESTQLESRTEEGLKKYYEVPASFVVTLLKRLQTYREYFTIYHSFHGGEKTEYRPIMKQIIKKSLLKKRATRL